MASKKWVTVLSGDQVEWVENTAKAIGLKGSAIIGEAINRCMRDNGQSIKADLMNAKIQLQLKAVENKIKERENKLKEAERQKKELLNKAQVLSNV